MYQWSHLFLGLSLLGDFFPQRFFFFKLILEREKNINWLHSTCALTRIEPITWVYALTRNLTGDLLVHGKMLNQLTHNKQGCWEIFDDWFNLLVTVLNRFCISYWVSFCSLYMSRSLNIIMVIQFVGIQLLSVFPYDFVYCCKIDSDVLFSFWF